MPSLRAFIGCGDLEQSAIPAHRVVASTFNAADDQRVLVNHSGCVISSTFLTNAGHASGVNRFTAAGVRRLLARTASVTVIPRARLRYGHPPGRDDQSLRATHRSSVVSAAFSPAPSAVDALPTDPVQGLAPSMIGTAKFPVLPTTAVPCRSPSQMDAATVVVLPKTDVLHPSPSPSSAFEALFTKQHMRSAPSRRFGQKQAATQPNFADRHLPDELRPNRH
jgi:hypothetical protein